MITLAAAEQLTTNTLTTAGLAVGVGLLAVEHVRWWRGGGGAAKDPKVLIPFWFGVSFGTLAVACPAGMLGAGAGFLRWGGNGLGGWVMSTMTGQSAGPIAQAAAPSLDENGAIVVTALVIVLFWLRKTFGKPLKGKWWRGVWAGTLLAISTGTFAMIGDLVVPGVNDIGSWAIEGLVHGVLA